MHCRLNNTCDLEKRNCKALIVAVSFFMNFLVSSYIHAQNSRESENTSFKSSSTFKKENLACFCYKYQLKANREFDLVLEKAKYLSHSEKIEPYMKRKTINLYRFLPIRIKKKRLKNVKFSKLHMFCKSIFKRSIQKGSGIDACPFL